MDVAFATKKSVDQHQLSAGNVCGVSAKDANAAAISYPLCISGFWISTIEQKGLEDSHTTRSCGQMQCSGSLQQARNCTLP